MFLTRWRWDASIALALPRFRGGNKVPRNCSAWRRKIWSRPCSPTSLLPGKHRRRPRDTGPPLVKQTIDDCLFEAMDIEGFENLLRAIERGEVESKPATWSSLRRSHSKSCRPVLRLPRRRTAGRAAHAGGGQPSWLDPESAADIGRLDPEAIARVKEEAWPQVDSADELHDALGWLGLLTTREVARQPEWMALLGESSVTSGSRESCPAASRIAQRSLSQRSACRSSMQCIRRSAGATIVVPAEYAKAWSREEALVEIVRGRLEGLGPVTAAELAESIAVPASDIDVALLALEGEGFVMRGSFTPDAGAEWCERRLLARITRYTVKRLRQEIEPVSEADFMQFLFDWQHVGERMEGPDAVAAVVSQLEGFEAAAGSWETELIPHGFGYEPHWLDDLCRAGRVVWTRLEAPKMDASRTQGSKSCA